MKMTNNKASRLRHYMNASKSFLRRARDLYVNSLINFDGKVSSANVMACHLASNLPNNFRQFSSTLDDDERLKEMYKSISKKYIWSSMEFDKMNGINEGSRKGYSAIDRSYSVALGKIGTIDEEEPCDFHEQSQMFMRSRSHAVTMINGSYYY